MPEWYAILQLSYTLSLGFVIGVMIGFFLLLSGLSKINQILDKLTEFKLEGQDNKWLE